MSGKNQASKFRFLFGTNPYEKAKQKEFTNIAFTNTNTDGAMCCANNKFFAVPWKEGGGGNVVVVPTHTPQRFGPKTQFIPAHGGDVLDLCFNPFADSILATCGKDGGLKLFDIPEGGADKTTKPAVGLKAHGNRCLLLKWHPTTDYTIATGSMDGTMKVWDVQKQTAATSQAINNGPYAMDWNYDGSLVGMLNKDKDMFIMDPRQQAIASSGRGHQGSKPQRLHWIGATSRLLTVGTNEYNEREYMIHDARDVSKPLKQTKLDNNSQIMFSYFDNDTNVFWVSNKGSAFAQFFYLDETKPTPELVQLDKYTGKENAQFLSFFQKRSVDCSTNELMRAIRFCGKTAQVMQFKVNRKDGNMAEELFPPFQCGTPAQTFDEYYAGKNAPPILAEWDPSGGPQKSAGGAALVVTGAPPPVKRTSIMQAMPMNLNSGMQSMQPQATAATLVNPYSQPQVASTGALDKKISDLTKENDAKDAQIKSLQRQINDLKGTVKITLTKPVLGYWDIRGFAQAIRFQLAYMGVDFNDKQYASTADMESRKEWLAEKPQLGMHFPNLPYFLDTSGTKISESLAIHQYCADKYMPELLGRTPEERATVEMVAGIIGDMKKAIAGICYGSGDKQAAQNTIFEKIQPLTTFMGANQFLIGDNMCYMDFVMYELLQLCNFLADGQLNENIPVWAEYQQRIYYLPGIATVQDALLPHVTPFNMRFSKINDWCEAPSATEEPAAAEEEEANPYAQ